MQVVWLQANNFRKLGKIALELHPKLNLVFGDNAAGKTSLLELFHVAAHGRPFTGSFEDALGPDENFWRVAVAGYSDDIDHITLKDRIVVSFQARRHHQSLNGKDCATADLAKLLPAALLDPGSHTLLSDGPARRRRYLDWGLFHVEQDFLSTWRRYRRALRQRNLLLRSDADRAQLLPWTRELIQTGSKLHDYRKQQADRVREDVLSHLESLVGHGPWSIKLDSGWDPECTLAESITRNEKTDRRMGQTIKGPHRAELVFSRAGSLAQRRLSRGEEKLAVAALLVAQTAVIRRLCARKVLILVDDFTSEMGDSAQARLLDLLLKAESQVVITSLNRSSAIEALDDYAMFHVEHGRVATVVK